MQFEGAKNLVYYVLYPNYFVINFSFVQQTICKINQTTFVILRDS